LKKGEVFLFSFKEEKGGRERAPSFDELGGEVQLRKPSFLVEKKRGRKKKKRRG